MRWAEVGSGFVSQITVSDTEEFGADWLASAVGGEWALIPDGVEAGIGYAYDSEAGLFVAPEPAGVPDEVV